MPIAVYARALLERVRARRRHRGVTEQSWLRDDPRTDHLYSIRNLLRMRAEDNEWPVLALGTSYDVLVAASEQGRPGEALLVDCRQAISSGFPTPASVRFAVGSQVLVLVADGRASVPVLLDIAERVRCILWERARAVARR